MQKLFTFLFIITVSVIHAQKPAVSSGDPFKIGYINIDSVLVNMKDYAAQVKILEAFQKQLTAQFEVKNLEFEQKYKEYQEKEKGYTEEQKKEKFAELQKLDQELSKLRSESNKEIANKENELLVPLNNKILKAIEIVAKTKGYSHITDIKNFYYAMPSFDVTKLVIEEANKL
jgi:outer membrane protein